MISCEIKTGDVYRKLCGLCGAVRIDKQIGLEDTPEAYVARLVAVFREVRRVLRDDGTIWVNLGDSYTGSSKSGGANKVEGNAYRIAGTPNKRGPDLKPKDLIGIPWMVAFALRADGWYLRNEIIWHKRNPMPESVRDRCTKAHEQIFLLAKSEKYYFDADAIREPHSSNWLSHLESRKSCAYKGCADRKDLGRSASSGNEKGRNKRTVWSVSSQRFNGAHFAAFPEGLILPCVLAGCPVGGTVLDPFSGAATTGLVALKNGRNYIGTELNPEYVAMANSRLANAIPELEVAS